MTFELRECPFCGGVEPHLMLNGTQGHIVAHVECSGCGARSRDVIRAVPEHPGPLAVESWNRRA